MDPMSHTVSWQDVKDVNNTSMLYKQGETPIVVDTDATQAYLAKGWSQTPIPPKVEPPKEAKEKAAKLSKLECTEVL